MAIEIGPQELKGLLDRNAPIKLIDVREKWERDICAIKGSEHSPVGSLAKKIHDLPRDRLLIFYCHSGQRSLYAAEEFSRHGFQAQSLAGGILAWAAQIEPGMARY